MGLNYFAKAIAIVLSLAAGTISVFGLAAIFSGAYWEVVIVMSILELAKVVTATWLHKYWTDISYKFKIYLCVAVVVLMAITSMGIYGFFARAHIEQQLKIQTGQQSVIPLLESQINTEKQKIADLDTQLGQIDSSLKAMTDKGKATKDAQRALAETDKQRKTRQSLVDQKDTISKKIISLELEKSNIENQVKKQEAEVGPLKYLANVFYDSANTEQLERAVRWLIIVIVIVFDPLAVALLIASSYLPTRQVPVTEQPVVQPEPVKLPTVVAEKVSVGRTRPYNGQYRQKPQRPITVNTRPVRAVDMSRIKLD